MAKKLWVPQEASTKLLIKQDGSTFIKADDQARLDNFITPRQADADVERTELASELGYADLTSYDDALQKEEWEIRQRLRYLTNFQTRVENITVADGEWFTPTAVNSVCGEEVGNEADLSIDGLNTTFWRHAQNHQHSIDYDLLGFPMKLSKFRIRYGGSAAVERLNNISFYAANKVADLGSGLLEASINLIWPAGPSIWVEHVLAKKDLKSRFARVEIGDTDNANNTLQMREFAVWFETLEPNE